MFAEGQGKDEIAVHSVGFAQVNKAAAIKTAESAQGGYPQSSFLILYNGSDLRLYQSVLNVVLLKIIPLTKALQAKARAEKGNENYFDEMHGLKVSGFIQL